MKQLLITITLIMLTCALTSQQLTGRADSRRKHGFIHVTKTYKLKKGPLGDPFIFVKCQLLNKNKLTRNFFFASLETNGPVGRKVLNDIISKLKTQTFYSVEVTYVGTYKPPIGSRVPMYNIVGDN